MAKKRNVAPPKSAPKPKRKPKAVAAVAPKPEPPAKPVAKSAKPKSARLEEGKFYVGAYRGRPGVVEVAEVYKDKPLAQIKKWISGAPCNLEFAEVEGFTDLREVTQEEAYNLSLDLKTYG